LRHYLSSSALGKKISSLQQIDTMTPQKKCQVDDKKSRRNIAFLATKHGIILDPDNKLATGSYY